jgi:hypothetical protein
VKKEKVREKGFLIARIPSLKRKVCEKRLLDSQNSIVKRRRGCEKRP